jgi:hypothetical protein
MLRKSIIKTPVLGIQARRSSDPIINDHAKPGASMEPGQFAPAACSNYRRDAV